MQGRGCESPRVAASAAPRCCSSSSGGRRRRQAAAAARRRYVMALAMAAAVALTRNWHGWLAHEVHSRSAALRSGESQYAGLCSSGEGVGGNTSGLLDSKSARPPKQLATTTRAAPTVSVGGSQGGNAPPDTCISAKGRGSWPKRRLVQLPLGGAAPVLHEGAGAGKRKRSRREGAGAENTCGRRPRNDLLSARAPRGGGGGGGGGGAALTSSCVMLKYRASNAAGRAACGCGTGGGRVGRVVRRGLNGGQA